VLVPEAESTVGDLRAELDPASSMAAHITVLYPFAPPRLLESATSELAAMFAGIDAFDFTLADVGWFDDRVVYVAPRPAASFVELTTSVMARFPQYRPYGGAFAEVIPHLCIAEDAPSDRMRDAADIVASHLPLAARVTAVQLMTYVAAHRSWQLRESFALRPTPILEVPADQTVQPPKLRPL
jgi:2'-5' RNA ligase